MAVGPSIFNQGTSVYDLALAGNFGIIPLQLQQPSAPGPSTVGSGTNLLVPDAPTLFQLRNFPEEVYDLRNTSHLVRLMKVLLGDAGVGQLRKRTLLTRLETALSGANFFDIDRFYGALFGALRTQDEQLTINPMDDVATPDEWDQIYAIDTNFRERIMLLAKAIMMGATPTGLQAAAQALVSVPVDVYETWALLDSYGPSYTRTFNTWAQVHTAYPNWSNFKTPTVPTWSDLEGALNVGRLPVATRGEVVIRPHKNYDGLSPTERAVDANALARVLQVLKPASTIVTIATDAGDIHKTVNPSGIEADSNYWEVVRKVTPSPALDDPTINYPLSAGQASAGVDPARSRIVPIPPFSQGQGVTWSLNGSIRSVKGYSRSLIDAATGDVADNWFVSPIPDEATIVYPDGVNIKYSAQNGVMSAQRAAAALSVNDGSLICHPYSGDRQAVASHD